MSSYLDRYGRAKSICHRLPALVKLGLSTVVVVAAVATPIEMWPLHGVLLCLTIMGLALAGIPVAYVARRLKYFLPMMALLSIAMPMSQGFEKGWEIGGSIFAASTLSFLAGLWLVNVMPFDQLLVTLRRLYVPAVLVAILAFMYRYIFVLWDELDKMRVARRARTFDQASLAFRWKTSAQLIGMLAIRALTRAERVEGAMRARGWDGSVHSLE